MGQVSNDDSGKVNAQAPAAAPETNPNELPDVQLELPCDIVDAHGVTTTVTAKVTITKPAFRMLCSIMMSALDALGVVPSAVDDKDEPTPEPEDGKAHEPAQEPA